MISVLPETGCSRQICAADSLLHSWDVLCRSICLHTNVDWQKWQGWWDAWFSQIHTYIDVYSGFNPAPDANLKCYFRVFCAQSGVLDVLLTLHGADEGNELAGLVEKQGVKRSRTHQVFKASHLHRWWLSLRFFSLQLSALTVQRHWHDFSSKAHFLPLQGRHRGLWDGEGEGEEGGKLVGGGDGDDGGARREVGGGRRGGGWVTALLAPRVFCLDFPLSFFLPFLVGFTEGLVVGAGWNSSFNLHSHWLCSMKGSSMSSCFMKEVLISSMVRVCVSTGTHSKASSEQQPPHRLTETQDGTKRWCVSPGNSRQTSTRVSRGSQPLLE